MTIYLILVIAGIALSNLGNALKIWLKESLFTKALFTVFIIVGAATSIICTFLAAEGNEQKDVAYAKLVKMTSQAEDELKESKRIIKEYEQKEADRLAKANSNPAKEKRDQILNPSKYIQLQKTQLQQQALRDAEDAKEFWGLGVDIVLSVLTNRIASLIESPYEWTTLVPDPVLITSSNPATQEVATYSLGTKETLGFTITPGVVSGKNGRPLVINLRSHEKGHSLAIFEINGSSLEGRASTQLPQEIQDLGFPQFSAHAISYTNTALYLAIEKVIDPALSYFFLQPN